MALFRSVSASLTKRPPEDDELADLPNVQAAYELYVKWLAAGAIGAWDGVGVSGPSPATIDGLVNVAETAIHQRNDFSTAMNAIQTFLAQDPPRNQVIYTRCPCLFRLSVGDDRWVVVFQFYCRALLCRSLVEADSATCLSGLDALHQTQQAIGTVLEALQVATKVLARCGATPRCLWCSTFV
jgi:hypothetical protein